MAPSHERGISRVTFVDRPLSLSRIVSETCVTISFRSEELSRERAGCFGAREKGRSLKIIKIKFPSPPVSRRGKTSETLSPSVASTSPLVILIVFSNSRSLNTQGSVLIDITHSATRFIDRSAIRAHIELKIQSQM